MKKEIIDFRSIGYDVTIEGWLNDDGDFECFVRDYKKAICSESKASDSDFVRCVDNENKGAHNVRTLGGDQKAITITEDGIFQHAERSRNEKAKKFQKYIAYHMKQLRKHGVTGTRDYWQNELDSGDERRVLIAKLHLHDMDEMEAKLKAEKERADKAEETIKEMEDRDVKTIINDLNKKYEPKKIHKLSYSLLREHKVWDGMEINKAYSELFETYNNQNGIRSIAYKSEKREEVKKLIDDWLTLHFAKEEIKKMILFDKES